MKGLDREELQILLPLRKRRWNEGSAGAQTGLGRHATVVHVAPAGQSRKGAHPIRQRHSRAQVKGL